MRISTLARSALFLLLPAGAAAQPAAVPAGVVRVGEVDFGVRVNGIDGDPARFQRLRDARDGATLQRFRYDRDTDTWGVRVEADSPGYRDQRYAASLTQYGRLRATVEWNQVPLFYSTDTSTPYRQEADGVFRLEDAWQAAVEGGAAAAAAVLAPQSRRFDLRSRRDVADLRVDYSVNRATDLTARFTSTARTGAQPWGLSFGQTNAVALPVPVDHRTNDLNVAAEWSSPRGMARVAYDGSWFGNAVETLVADNPLRLTDSPAAPAQGRMALWPDSTAHTVSASGSVTLPARSRAFGYVSIGSWLQNQALLPFTINSAIAALPLARPTAEAEARIVAMNYRVTSRPSPVVWLNGQLRVYDYDNRTPHFPVSQYVRVDSGVASSLTGGSEPFGYTRQFADLDASFTPLRFTAFRLGYGREHDDRTFRFLEETTEHTLRAAIDSTGLAWGSVRLQYDHAVRTGDGLDEEALSDIGEQVSLRQFDISDRTRDRVTAILQVVPIEALGFNASAGIGQENRPDAAFGLQDNDLRSFTVGIDAAPREAVLLAATYGLETYATLQRSRQANPGVQFDDPTRDWSTDMNEDVHTFTASLDLPQVAPRTAAHVGYDHVRSEARYLYLLPPNSTLTPPQPLAPVTNRIQRAAADVRDALTRQVALALAYAFDRFDVEDFAMSPGTLNSPVFTGFVNLRYLARPYEAHSGGVRLIYRW
jgi:MtrB/PioB family decaheme-associated outer membrane protein